MPRRSRGCQACRQRRIGCDGALPSCWQCVVSKRVCSGPIQGPIIINQTGDTVSKWRQKPTQTKVAESLLLQPCRRIIEYIALVESFTLFIAPRKPKSNQSWLGTIQAVSESDRGPALDISLRAAALAFSGVTSRNPQVVKKACELYGEALQQHSKGIKQGMAQASASAICTSVILSLFEAVWSTGSTGYIAHLGAAREMLALVTPGSEGGWPIRDISKHIQWQTFLIMVAAPHEYISTYAEMSSWPHVDELDAVPDQLMAQIFPLGDMLARKTCDQEENPSNIDLIGIELEIAHIWTAYQDEATESKRPIMWIVNGKQEFRDAFTALTVAYFAAARVLLLLVRPSSDSSESRYLPKHSEVILNCSIKLRASNIGCAWLRMFAPLTLVALHSPLAEQRREAGLFVDYCVKEMVFPGMSAISARRIQSHNESNTLKELSPSKESLGEVALSA